MQKASCEKAEDKDLKKKRIQKIKEDATASKAKGRTEEVREGCSAEKSSCMCITLSSRHKNSSCCFQHPTAQREVEDRHLLLACRGFSCERSHLEIQFELGGTVRHCKVKTKRSDLTNAQAACSSPYAMPGWYEGVRSMALAQD